MAASDTLILRNPKRRGAVALLDLLLDYGAGLLVSFAAFFGSVLLVLLAFLTAPLVWGKRRMRLYDLYLHWLYAPTVWLNFGRVRVRGLENLPKGGGYLLVANHASLLDIPFTFYLLNRAGKVQRLRMLAKQELYRIPMFGTALRLSGFIPVNRKNIHEALASYGRVRAALAEGTIIWISPEGGRSENGHLQPFKKGPFITAIESQAKVVPVALHGLHRMLPKNHFWVRGRQDVGFTIGQPIDATQYADGGVERLRDQVHHWFARTLSESRQQPLP